MSARFIGGDTRDVTASMSRDDLAAMILAYWIQRDWVEPDHNSGLNVVTADFVLPLLAERDAEIERLQRGIGKLWSDYWKTCADLMAQRPKAHIAQQLKALPEHRRPGVGP